MHLTADSLQYIYPMYQQVYLHIAQPHINLFRAFIRFLNGGIYKRPHNVWLFIYTSTYTSYIYIVILR